MALTVTLFKKVAVTLDLFAARWTLSCPIPLNVDMLDGASSLAIESYSETLLSFTAVRSINLTEEREKEDGSSQEGEF